MAVQSISLAEVTPLITATLKITRQIVEEQYIMMVLNYPFQTLNSVIMGQMMMVAQYIMTEVPYP